MTKERMEAALRVADAAAAAITEAGGLVQRNVIFDYGCSLALHITLGGCTTHLLITGNYVRGCFIPLDLLDLPEPEACARAAEMGKLVVEEMRNDPEPYEKLIGDP